ncbi:MAG: endonuclease domain-containing protein [Chloroflexi bacterium]|nr:endonuclease domain-containing protein [Chloroflexota bacterium]
MGESHPPRGVVRGQRVDHVKQERAQALRHEMTPAESVLWEQLRKNRLDGLHFRRQQVIEGFIVDFYCDTAALAVELDGEVHGNQQDYDRERDAVLNGKGIKVLRFANAQVTVDLEFVLGAIAESASLRTPSLPGKGQGLGFPSLPSQGRGRG